MNAWAAKRFWSDVSVVQDEGGFGIRVDGRVVRTPAKAPLTVPTRALAEAIAAEWDAVVDVIDPNVMPVTRSANAAIDKVAVQFDEVANMIAAYGGSDLLCYRAETPEELVQRQRSAWDPLLDWADETYGARLAVTAGIMPVAQEEQALAPLTQALFDATDFEMAAIHDLVALTGSLVLGLAVTQGHLTPSEAWDLSRIDEIWQAEQWGDDEDAAQAVEVKRLAFMHAATFYTMSKNKRSS